ncbi:helix-turn-helix transcriptional regulator [Clostridium culturomicium]|uniref:helix-turn-helix transcriptional regulator n=1 Tax=Clostridium culturomicium TaxID=1499683 RepID=UPI00385794F5
MGKLNNALSMLAILRSRTRVTRKELAEILEVSEREITRYKDDLEVAGVTINSVRGKYGYYEIANKDFLLNLDLSQSELTTLDIATNYFKDQQVHFYKDFHHINEKIKVASGIAFQETKGNYYFKGIKIRADYEEEKRKWLTINEAIITCRKVEMIYMNANGEESSRVVNPYGLFTYYNSNFFVEFCNKR